MTDYYVKHNGDDAAAGTSIATAWRTIGKGASTIGAGDRLLLVNDFSTYGPYWAGNLVSSTSGAKGAMGVFTDANVNFTDFDGNGNSVRPGDRLLCGLVMTTYTESFWVVSVTDAHTLVLSGTPSASNPITYVIRDQSGTSSAYPAIYWNSGNGSEANNAWQTLMSQDIASPSIIAGTAALARGTDADLLWINAANQIVRGLKFDMALGGRWGIRCYDSAQNNLWAAQILDNIFTGAGARGITVNQSFRALVSGNDISDFYDVGIFIYNLLAGGTLIINNRIHDGFGNGSQNINGIGTGGSTDGIGSIFAGNLIYNISSPSGSYAATGILNGGYGGHSFYNNTVYNISNSGDASKAYGFVQDNALRSTLSLFNNIFSDCYEGIWVNNGSIAEVGYNCLHGCTNNYGGDKLSGPTIEGSDVLEDPRFADAANGDFTPQNVNVLFGGQPDQEGNPATIGAIDPPTPYYALLREKLA